eukprot:7101634-Lingulodinium_polyedra.AAC.1
MAHNPFGPGIVASEGRSLGAWLVSPNRGPLLPSSTPAWTPASLECIAHGTWKRPASTVAHRTGCILQHPSSFAVRSEQWHTY